MYTYNICVYIIVTSFDDLLATTAVTFATQMLK